MFINKKAFVNDLRAADEEIAQLNEINQRLRSSQSQVASQLKETQSTLALCNNDNKGNEIKVEQMERSIFDLETVLRKVRSELAVIQ